MQKYPRLFSSIQIAGHTFKNRILCAPMLFGFYALEETAERVYKIIEDRAKGGAAEVVVGEVPINYTDAADAMFATADDNYSKKEGPLFDAYKKYADIIKKYNSIVSIEIFHAGQNRGQFSSKPDIPPWGPVGFTREDGVVVEPFDPEKMQKVCNDFAVCADFMKAAGFDGVLIHGAHGYLFTQFLSPAINRRIDGYGGSIENRGRFPREILKSVRDMVGREFVIELRINGADMVEGGATNEDIAEFCSTLKGLVNIIHVSSGFHMNSYETHTFTSHYDPHGINVERAARIKEKAGIPVTVVGGINSPEFAERIIAEGKVDFVSLGRQMIADPEFPIKAKTGREEEIRQCLRCYHCYGMSDPSKMGKPPFSLSMMLDGVENCTINPRANKEVIIDSMPKPRGSRNVLVIGGGPGGMQAAITACDRGHSVTLVEKNSSLGGTLHFTDFDIHKTDLRIFKDLLVREVKRRDINVVLNKEVTSESLADYGPDAIVLAIGASPKVPEISGIDEAVNVLDVYKKDARIGDRVLMIGGGLSGCETALHLADKGHEVIIIEMLDRLAAETGGMELAAVSDQIKKRSSISVKTGAKCIEIDLKGVKIKTNSGETEFIEGDTVVISLGMNAKRDESEHLRSAAGELPMFEIGDCVRSAKVFEAISEGFMAAMKIV
jgi:2,4-dienoyl-CoA reductase-like NADH-dependent reductase (Old Yellow Enzyme family)/thioredoxin reductase